MLQAVIVAARMGEKQESYLDDILILIFFAVLYLALNTNGRRGK